MKTSRRSCTPPTSEPTRGEGRTHWEPCAPFTVRSCTYDGRLKRSWPARLVRRADPLLVVEGVFDAEIRHPLLGRIAAGTLSTEFYWTDRWYSVFRFRQPSGDLRNFYCNLNTPPVLSEGRITFVDLDIDVLVAPDFSIQVLDVDEFELHAEQYQYPLELRRRTSEALAEVLQLIARRQFPFASAGDSEIS